MELKRKINTIDLAKIKALSAKAKMKDVLALVEREESRNSIHCDECGSSVEYAVEFDNGERWEDNRSATVCLNCLREALQMIEDAIKPEESNDF